MSVPAAPLPNVLLLLVHLHLLDYPLKDATGYDELLFDPTRAGLRERFKAMEDICHFLVGKVEGGKDRARSILPTYPCLQPADTTAFRISLSRYLENLRHTSLSPTTSTDNKGRMPHDKKLPRSPTASETMWWWKDVVVRKSLLEECCGDRFERLLLALSTHALAMIIQLPSSTTETLGDSRQIESLKRISQMYATLLQNTQSARRAWERSASLLDERQRGLVLLRERLDNPSTASRSKYDDLATNRLIGLRDSQYHDLLKIYWTGEDGRRALQFLFHVVGLPAASSDPVLQHQLSSVGHITENVPEAERDFTELPTPPLPIAAAHHPTYLQQLQVPLFSAQVQQVPTDASKAQPVPVAQVIPAQGISERLDESTATREVLQAALARAELVRENVRKQLEQVKSSLGTATVSSPPTGLALRLWEGPPRKGVSFKQTASTPDLLATFSLPHPPSGSVIEGRIAQIRGTLLPTYPLIPVSPVPAVIESSPPTRVPAASTSKLQQPSTKGQWKVGTMDSEEQPQVKQPTGSTKSVRQPPQSCGATTSRQKLITREDDVQKQERMILEGGRRVSRRTSRRATAARVRRSTMFSLDEEIDKILESFEDGSPYDDDLATSKAIGRTIYVPLSSVKKSVPRPTFNMVQYEGTRAALPKLSLSEIEGHDMHFIRPGSLGENDVPDMHASQQDEFVARADEPGDEEEYYEGHSVTLKEILLKAGNGDVPQFDLLGNGDDDEDLDDEEFDWS